MEKFGMTQYRISSNEVFYQIFVGSFADGNGDGIGDIRGIIENLDYLNDGADGGLGIGGIWLTPIHLSDSFHKYDALDYKKIATQFGNLEDFQELIEEAHKRKIKVILDLVFNCVSNDHVWFKEALNNKSSKYRDYFYFWDKYDGIKGYSQDDAWVGNSVWHEVVNKKGDVVDKYIGIYGSSMPDLNFFNKQVREECKQVASYWLDKGVDGFRLDSAMHLFSEFEAPGEDFHQLNIEWWQEFYEHCRTIKPDVYLVGEVWADNNLRARYMQGLKSNFQFFLGDAISDVITNNTTAKEFNNLLKKEYNGFRHFNGNDYINAPFLSNHDQPRFAGLGYSTEQLKMSANIYLTLEGLPFIYYGEELGVQGPRTDGTLPDISFEWPHGEKDIFVQNRTAFPWDNKYETRQIFYADGGNTPSLPVQMKDRKSLYHHYKNLIFIRKKFTEFDRGYIDVVETGYNLISYKISNGQKSIMIVHNVSENGIQCKFNFKYRYVTDIDHNQRSKFTQNIYIDNWNSYIFSDEDID